MDATPDQQLPRDICPLPVAGTAPSAAQDADNERQRLQRSLRQSEKRARARRAEKIRAMHEQVEALSRVLFVLPIVDHADAVWDEFLDDQLKRVRHRMRRLLPAAQEVQQLLNERALRTRLLQEHALMVRAVLTEARELEQVPKSPVDNWDSNVQRWRALARIHFRPWTIERCEHEIEQATNEMNRFLLSNDKQSTGLSFMGWEDSRRIDPNSSRFQFTLTKTFQGFDIDYYLSTSWRIYTEARVFGKIVIGDRAKLSFEVLQELTPTCCLVRFVESYDTLPLYVHRVYLIARIETDDGAVQFMRSVRVPEIERVINRLNDTWALDFFWMRWEILDIAKPRASTDFRASLGGTMFLEDLQYLHYWLFELLGAIVRSEAWSTNRQLLDF